MDSSIPDVVTDRVTPERQELRRVVRTSHPVSFGIFPILLFTLSALFTVSALSAVPAASAQGPGFVVHTVGAGSNCTHSTLRGALIAAGQNGTGGDEIRVAKDAITDHDQFFSNDETIVISGGWDNCSDNIPSGRTIVLGEAGLNLLASLTVDGSPGQVEVILNDIEIVGNEQAAIVLRNGAALRMQNSVARNGQIGVSMQDASSLVVDSSSLIHDNRSTGSFGGGVSCAGSSYALINGNIYDNSAERGGGIRADTGCEVEILDLANIDDNSASEQGGGIFLASGATLEAPPRTGSMTLARNSAREGGGIYLTDSSTEALLHHAHIVDNDAVEAGAGVLSSNGALFTMQVGDVPCSSPPSCSQLSGNELTGSGQLEGSAAYARTDGDLLIRQTMVDRNQDAAASGRLVAADGVGSILRLEGVHLWANQARFLASAYNGGFMTISYVSAAGNSYQALNGSTQDSFIAEEDSVSRIQIFSSAYMNTSGASSPDSVESDCIVADDLTDMVADRSYIGHPGFTDPANGNFRPHAGSPVVDYCDFSRWGQIVPDPFGNARTLDTATSNHHGPTDVGWIEYQEVPSSIFSDGFESGSTASWN